MNALLWSIQLAADVAFIAAAVAVLYGYVKLRERLETLERDVKKVGAMDEMLDDLELLLRQSSSAARDIERTVKRNTDQIDRRLGLLDLKREDLEAALDRADESLTHLDERSKRPPAPAPAPARPARRTPDARAGDPRIGDPLRSALGALAATPTRIPPPPTRGELEFLGELKRARDALR